jgi:cytochrome oxidase Cu insertion factor (SCO1/SenC/PrrC family)
MCPMLATTGERVTKPGELLPPEVYNYTHFRTEHLLRDGERTLDDSGVLPGELAPDFTLTTTDGLPLRLSELRGQPVLLHFGSFT